MNYKIVFPEGNGTFAYSQISMEDAYQIATGAKLQTENLFIENQGFKTIGSPPSEPGNSTVLVIKYRKVPVISLKDKYETIAVYSADKTILWFTCYRAEYFETLIGLGIPQKPFSKKIKPKTKSKSK